MADSTTKSRTNYFTVSDTARLDEIIKMCYTQDDEPVKLIEKDNNFCFYCEDEINGFMTDELFDETDGSEIALDRFYTALQDIVDPTDAIIITTMSYCKMQYICASAVIITKTAIEHIDFENITKTAAQKLLNNSDWDTRNDY